MEYDHISYISGESLRSELEAVCTNLNVMNASYGEEGKSEKSERQHGLIRVCIGY
jgi:hypothetical protein